MPEWLVKAMDVALSECWLKSKDEAFDQLMHLILNENVSGKEINSCGVFVIKFSF